MIFKKVESSNLEAIAYDLENKLLGVQFKGGKGSFYLYLGVPNNKYQQLESSDSVGTFFNAQIKSNYTAVKVESYTAPMVFVAGNVVSSEPYTAPKIPELHDSVEKKLLREAYKLLKEGKQKFAPHTTNSFVDSWLADYEARIAAAAPPADEWSNILREDARNP